MPLSEKGRGAPGAPAKQYQYWLQSVDKPHAVVRGVKLIAQVSELHLTMSANAATKSELLHYLDRLKHAA